MTTNSEEDTTSNDPAPLPNRPDSPPADRVYIIRRVAIPWTEEEHRMFLIGLKNLRRIDWRAISQNYVKSRTPTQVASHGELYLARIRRN